MLVNIVPTIPPNVNGVGDYLYTLWQNWAVPRPAWHCLAAQVPVAATEYWPEVGISSFALSREGLLHALEEVSARTVVLHYVGYAYHAKGCPVWLPGALKEWKHQGDNRLIVMFHELYATGKPWQSAFWLSPVARGIVVSLVRIADGWITSCPRAQMKLLSEASANVSKGMVIPIGSAIAPRGEVDFSRHWPLSHGGKLKVVVFGLPYTRLRALQAHENLLKQLCQQDLVESITEIGKSDNSVAFARSRQQVARRIGHAELWRSHYDLSSEQVTEVLLNQDLGLVPSEPSLLTKSSVYAAFCVHGIVVAAVHEANEGTENLVPSLINFDETPDSCIATLYNDNEIVRLKELMREASSGLLSWRGISQRWMGMTVQSA